MICGGRQILSHAYKNNLLKLRNFNGTKRKHDICIRFLSKTPSSEPNSRTKEHQTTESQQKSFLKAYKIRSSLERLIYHYAEKPLPTISMLDLYKQSEKLSKSYILENAKHTVESLLVYNARRIKQFRSLPYLVVLNPSISESYDLYLKTMYSLVNASLNLPTTLEENEKFTSSVFNEFIDAHSDTLPSLSKGFNEVLDLMSVKQISAFLDEHLKERISMRLIAHQHLELSNVLNDSTAFVEGGKYNGVIKPLNIREVVKKSADFVNDVCAIKYDQTVQINIDTNLYPPNYWSGREPELLQELLTNDFIFPYIEYHLDYILSELFKNSFRAHIENNVKDSVQVTISISSNPSYLELRIRDKGKGIPPAAIDHMFDYSFSTYESNEGESFKTLNVPPGLGVNSIAGIGYGLPLLKNYVEIFNLTIPEETGIDLKTKGLLSVQTYNGWGTDVYFKTVGS